MVEFKDLQWQKVRDIRVKDEACDVFFGHAGQLMGEDILKAPHPHQDLLVGLLVEGVANDVEFNHTSSLF